MTKDLAQCKRGEWVQVLGVSPAHLQASLGPNGLKRFSAGLEIQPWETSENIGLLFGERCVEVTGEGEVKKRADDMGMIYKRGSVYWIKYYLNGRLLHANAAA